jgi:hypothetical protein
MERREKKLRWFRCALLCGEVREERKEQTHLLQEQDKAEI